MKYIEIQDNEIDCKHDWVLTGESHSSTHDVWFYKCSICKCKLTDGGSINGDIYELYCDISQLRKSKLNRIKQIENG